MESERKKPVRTTIGFITIGSSKKDVIRIHGTPSSITKLSYTEYWYYGSSRVKFSKTGRVIEWNNAGNLKVKLVPGPNVTGRDYVTIGSTKDDVIRLHGTPSSITKLSYTEYWYYGSSRVKFSKNSRVIEWNNAGNLKVKLE